MTLFVIIFSSLMHSMHAFAAQPERTYFAMGSALKLGTDRSDSFSEQAIKLVIKFEEEISTWNKNSLLSKFNRAPAGQFHFNANSYLALKQAVSCGDLTKGHFHPGIFSLINLWGLRDKITIPTFTGIKNALIKNHYQKLQFNDEHRSIFKHTREFGFEEGGFAKGMALDLIVQEARNHTGKELFLDFSGQIFSEQKAEIGIAHPEDRQTIALTVSIENESLSTSAIGVQHFVHRGKVYGHILNPKTGYPLVHKQKSMSVIHPYNFWADCLSTGLLVMSENKNEFRKWIKKHPEIKFIYLERKGNNLFAETSCKLKNKIRTNENISQIVENC